MNKKSVHSLQSNILWLQHLKREDFVLFFALFENKLFIQIACFAQERNTTQQVYQL